ncbi:hypothetical protein BKA63DRAFT_522281 [Paraphoma chrysanthemicola]|nr:hypothetical protein BKA63DRAFT_522281 [Paraphoma chrysanthemicola]
MMDEIWKLVQARDQLQAQGTRQANFIAELSRSFNEQTQALDELRLQHVSQRNIIAKQAQAIEELRVQCAKQQREPTEAFKTADAAKVYNMIPGLPTRFPPAPNRTSSARDSAVVLTPTTSPTSSHMVRTPSTGSIVISKPPAPAKSTTWASRAAAPPPAVSESPVYKPIQCEVEVPRNRAGQRIDPPAVDYNKDEVNRVKNLKLCNVHYLRKECPYGSKCQHDHVYNASAGELKTLRLVARMAFCAKGSACEDKGCIYGHRCTAPLKKVNGRTTKTCLFGESCKFPPDLHDIDMRVVRAAAYIK